MWLNVVTHLSVALCKYASQDGLWPWQLWRVPNRSGELKPISVKLSYGGAWRRAPEAAISPLSPPAGAGNRAPPVNRQTRWQAGSTDWLQQACSQPENSPLAEIHLSRHFCAHFVALLSQAPTTMNDKTNGFWCKLISLRKGVGVSARVKT